jgi:hypothetical protein
MKRGQKRQKEAKETGLKNDAGTKEDASKLPPTDFYENAGFARWLPFFQR